MGVGINDRHGSQVLQFMSDDEGVVLQPGARGRFVIDFTFDNWLAHGDYSVNVGISTQGEMPTMPIYRASERILDSTFGGLVFTVPPYSRKPIFGKVGVPVEVALVSGAVRPEGGA